MPVLIRRASVMSRAAAVAPLILASLVLYTHSPVLSAADGDLQSTSSNPAAGSFLTSAPSQVRVTVSSSLRSEGSFVSVMAPGGREISQATTQLDADGRTLVANLPSGLTDGLYSVTWRGVAASGTGTGEGAFDFGLRIGGQIPTIRSDRSTANPGSLITLSGNGYKKSGSVVVSASVDDELVSAGRADEDGVVRLQVTLPSDLPNGPQRITVADGDGAFATTNVQIMNSSANPLRVRVSAESQPTSVTFHVSVVNRSGTDLRLDAVRLPAPAGTTFVQATNGGHNRFTREAGWDGLSVRAGETLGPLSATFDTRDVADGTQLASSAWVRYALPIPTPAASVSTPTRGSPTATPPRDGGQGVATSDPATVKAGGLD